MNDEFLPALLLLLEGNRRFPKYRFDKRAALFLNLFLPDVIQWKFGKEYRTDIIVPEFPLRKEGSKESTSLDFFVVCKSQKTGFLVEFKTEKQSCSIDQLLEFTRLQPWGFLKILEEVHRMAFVTKGNYRRKYQHLYALLSEGPGHVKLEILYILPAAGKEKFIQKLPEITSLVHFITLEELTNAEIPGPFREEWEIIRHSKIFQPGN